MLSAFFSTVFSTGAILAAEAGAASAPAPVIVSPAPMAVEAAVSVAKAPASVIVLAEAASINAAKPSAATPLAFDGVSDADVAAKVVAYLEGLSTLAGDFVQTAPSGAVVAGKFHLRRPGQIRFDYDDPSPITIVATGGMVYVQNDDLETTDSYPLKKTPLKFLLSKKIDLKDATLKSVDRAADAVAVTYASTDEETEGEITLILSAPNLAIEQWAVRDLQGGVTTVALSGVTSGGALDNRLFRAPDAGGAFINN